MIVEAMLHAFTEEGKSNLRRSPFMSVTVALIDETT
jgi:hypothetical protein